MKINIEIKINYLKFKFMNHLNHIFFYHFYILIVI